MKAVLVLEDGTSLVGEGFGYQGVASGEVVFNTGMIGYQRIITDPTYYRQLVVLTYPLIGNYGVSFSEVEGSGAFAGGLIVREISLEPSNWKMEMTLNEYLQEQKVVGISQIDTRFLTRLLRDKGTMRGIISSRPEDVEDPASLMNRWEEMRPVGWEEIKAVSTENVYRRGDNGPLLCVVDLGIKLSLLRQLEQIGCQLIVVPADIEAKAIAELDPAGLFFTNGPGDPRVAGHAVDLARRFMENIPLAGVGLGHQVLALALGLGIEKMRFGHRGANHPVKDQEGKVSITSQHHGYVVSRENIPQDVVITHRHLNDDTIEGISHKYLPVFGVQYHPQDENEFNQVFAGFLTKVLPERRTTK